MEVLRAIFIFSSVLLYLLLFNYFTTEESYSNWQSDRLVHYNFLYWTCVYYKLLPAKYIVCYAYFSHIVCTYGVCLVFLFQSIPRLLPWRPYCSTMTCWSIKCIVTSHLSHQDSDIVAINKPPSIPVSSMTPIQFQFHFHLWEVKVETPCHWACHCDVSSGWGRNMCRNGLTDAARQLER